MKTALFTAGMELPEPIKNTAVKSFIQYKRMRDKNYTEYTWKSHRFKLPYFDRVTFSKANTLLENGKIAHEEIPLSNFELNPSRDVILDIGAQFGVYSVVLGILNPDLEVHSFEPDPYNCNILDLYCAANNLSADRVKIHQKVVSDSEGQVEFFTSPTE